MSASEIINKVWNYAHVLRDDGVGYGDKGCVGSQRLGPVTQKTLTDPVFGRAMVDSASIY
jgi:hypothetical protein